MNQSDELNRTYDYQYYHLFKRDLLCEIRERVALSKTQIPFPSIKKYWPISSGN